MHPRRGNAVAVPLESLAHQELLIFLQHFDINGFLRATQGPVLHVGQSHNLH
jgi:hypothetical protein